MEKKYKITTDLNDKIAWASQDQSLLEALLSYNIEIDHSCGGNGTCGTCRVYITEGLQLISEPTLLEKEIILERSFTKNERLACQAMPRGHCHLKFTNEHKND